MCEFCGNDKDIIFPFQLSKCQRCEGEPSTRAPSSRVSFPLNWRDWKISHPRRLAKVLQKDRREGEGGEEDIGLGSDQEDETEDLRPDRGRVFATSGETMNAFPQIVVIEDKQEMARSSSEGEEKMQGKEGGEEQRVHKKEDNHRETTDKSAKRENVDLLKILKIGRLKKNVAKQDRSSENETWSSRDSLDKVGQEGKGRRMVLGFTGRVRRFAKLGNEDGGEAEPKKEAGNGENIKRSLEKGEGREEEQKAEAEAENETSKPEKLAAMKLLQPRQQVVSLSKERSGGEKDEHSDEKDLKGELKCEEGQVDPEGPAQPKWRNSKTRKARRVSRGRKMRERRRQDEEPKGERDDDEKEEKQS